ncbi:GntR family transcriptional regulator [Lysinibacillus sp. FSL W8-0992]|uniref:GntR family transcriptional regulator n=1 Tax=Lysinibacillus sp. FSL W8-0992 TaxID=2954643 RepID=UPI0030F6B745
MLQMKIDTNSQLQIYKQVVNQIIELIAKGQIQHNDSLPSVRNMAKDIGINIHTVSKSYHELEKKGIIKMENRVKAKVIASSNQVIEESKLHNFELSIKNVMMEAYVMGFNKKKISQSITKILDELD